jgi:hypothetical protein
MEAGAPHSVVMDDDFVYAAVPELEDEAALDFPENDDDVGALVRAIASGNAAAAAAGGAPSAGAGGAGGRVTTFANGSGGGSGGGGGGGAPATSVQPSVADD